MADIARPRILPMTTAGTQHLIERTYREGGTFQWVRETFINAREAGATRVEFGIEWQAVESLGVYRRLIADNGIGMTPEQLVEFFNTFGGGGKPIGGVHENFGVGAKTSLLPWNPYGVVVISWAEGDPAMIWVRRDPDTGEYGLTLERTIDPDSGEESWDEVYGPYEDEQHGCNWSAIKPDWIEQHGTVIVLMGEEATSDTVHGDPSRAESDLKGLSAYLNRRLWERPQDVEILVDELRTEDRGLWPRSELEAHKTATGPQDRRTNRRTIEAARHYVEYPSARGGGLAASGIVPLLDGTEVHWYLWAGDRPAVQSYAAIGGYIAALYRNELYDVTNHHSTYRTFGISEGEVRKNTWLIVVPPLYDESDGKLGVYPRTDRNALLLRGGPNAGGPLPFSEWGREFADRMPEELFEAIKAAREGRGGTVTDDGWRQRLAERFGSRWRIRKLVARAGGTLLLDPSQAGSTPPRTSKKRRGQGSRSGSAQGTGPAGTASVGSVAGPEPAKQSQVAGGIPHWRTVNGSELGDGMLAAWQPNDPVYPEGAVLINVHHPVLVQTIQHWQDQYAEIDGQAVADEVIRAYGEVAVAKVAHSEYLKSLLPSKVITDELRSEAALTMSLLGLIAEEALIAPRLGGKFRKRPSV